MWRKKGRGLTLLRLSHVQDGGSAVSALWGQDMIQCFMHLGEHKATQLFLFRTAFTYHAPVPH